MKASEFFYVFFLGVTLRVALSAKSFYGENAIKRIPLLSLTQMFFKFKQLYYAKFSIKIKLLGLKVSYDFFINIFYLYLTSL